jgi:hypothetical protein
MKQGNVRKLYLAKRAILQGDETQAIQRINSVLLDENGAAGVLYPHNDKISRIISLWGECRKPENIASQLGVDEEVVLCAIEDPENYKETV